jgi:hypothetical protein
MQKEKENHIKKHYKKILAAAGVVTIAGVSYVVCKKFVGLEKTNEMLREDVDILRAAASEGLYEEAIATTTRKLNFRQDRLKYTLNFLKNNPNDAASIAAVEKIESEINELLKRRDSFIMAQKIFAIQDNE